MKKTIILILILFGLFCSCAKQTENKDNNENVNSPKESVIHSMRTLLLTPENLRTADENALLKQIETTVHEYVILENERFKIIITEKEWIDMGLNKEYYDMLKKDVEDINHYLDTTSFSEQLLFDSYLKSQEEFTTEKIAE